MADTAAPAVPVAAPGRVAAIDAYRGFVMFLMMAEVLQLAAASRRRSRSVRSGQFLALHQTHVEWAGCTLHDLIQPSFSFLVGVALPFSIAGRGRTRADVRGCSRCTRCGGRSLLVLLGVFLRSIVQQADELDLRGHALADRPGLRAAVPARLHLRPRWQWSALGRHPRRLLGGVRALSAAGGFRLTQAVGVPADWPHHYTGFAAHWNKNSNLAWALRHAGS